MKKIVQIIILLLSHFILNAQEVASLDLDNKFQKNSDNASLIYYRPSNVFTNPYLLIDTFNVEAIPLEHYSAKEIEIQQRLNVQEESVITFSSGNETFYERDIDNEEITPYTWKWIHLQKVEEDGSYTNIHLRRPNWWLLENNATNVGNKIHLTIPQAGIDKELLVIKIYPNTLDTRFWKDDYDGIHISRPITGKIEHYVNNVVDITFNDDNKPISVTTNHLLWSADKNDWVSVGDLEIGEQLTTKNGSLILTSRTPKEDWHIVYDLEVYRDHNFLVGEQYVLAHNGCPDNIGRSGAFKKAKRDAGIEVNQQPLKVEKVKMTDKYGKPILDEKGNTLYSREYHYKGKDGKIIVIQDHSAGHKFGEVGGKGDQGAHFNVRPSENTRTGSVPGTQAHYNFNKKTKK